MSVFILNFIKKILHSPLYILFLYLFLILIFSLVYWCNPSFWEAPLSFIQSLYFSIVTITTLGYGDITPKTDSAMLFTALEALAGILIIGLFLNAIAHNLSTKEKEKLQANEDIKWKPARLLVARHTCRVHQMVFSAFRYIIDVNNQTDLNSHGFPPNTTQRQANAWAKEHAIKPLDFHYDELKKMLEYNNVALDSELQPKVVHFIVAAGELINTCKFVVHAYKGQEGAGFGGSFNFPEAKVMASIYNELLEVYPEIVELEKPIHPQPEPAENIHALVEESNEKCYFLDLRVV